MKKSLNKVELIGFAGTDPETKTVGERKLSTFNLATDESYKKNDEWVKVTQWHRLTGWGKISDKMTEIVKKGKLISITGKLNHRSYDDKNGVKQYTTEIVVTNVKEILEEVAEA